MLEVDIHILGAVCICVAGNYNEMAGQKLIYDLSITVVLLLMDCSFFLLHYRYGLWSICCLQVKREI